MKDSHPGGPDFEKSLRGYGGRLAEHDLPLL